MRLALLAATNNILPSADSSMPRGRGPGGSAASIRPVAPSTIAICFEPSFETNTVSFEGCCGAQEAMASQVTSVDSSELRRRDTAAFLGRRPAKANEIESLAAVLQAGFEIGLIEAVLLGLFERVGAKAHRAIFADDFPVRRLIEILELEQLLGNDHVAFHPDHFGDVGGAARAVAEALHLDDEIDRIRDLAA